MNEAVRVTSTEAERGFAAHYEAAKPTLPGGDSDWVRGLRLEAMDRFGERGLPHRRIEEWKYTDLRAAIGEAYPAPTSVAPAHDHADVARALGDLGALDCHRVVLLDGRFRAELSDVGALAGLAEIMSLADALSAPPDWVRARLGQVNPQHDDPVVVLNTGLMGGGMVLRVAEGAEIAKPVHVVHVHAASDPVTVTTRQLVEVGEGATLTLIESHVSLSNAPALVNAATELVAGSGATVHHIKVQREAAETTHLSSWMADLGADVTYRGFQFSTGAKLARNQVFLRFAGEGADAETSGAVMLRDRQHVDTTLVVDHAVPGGRSREYFKTVLDDEARGVLQCKVIVRPGAQKTDGHQMAQALLLSERAEFDSKPELEIFADDVVCGHGSTSGQIDEGLLFYLRARGIPEVQARALLITAFVGEAIEKIAHVPLRDLLLDATGAWLGSKG